MTAFSRHFLGVEFPLLAGLRRRPARRFRFRTLKTQLHQIQLVDEHVDHPDWVVLGDALVQNFGK
jgi:hypothetical protein